VRETGPPREGVDRPRARRWPGSARLTGARSTVTDATSEYRADQDVLQHFVDARCTTGAGQRVKGSALYASYKQWAEIAGEFITSERDFSNAMTDRGYSRYRTKIERGWEGIGLTAESEMVDDSLGDFSDAAEAFD
jgi:phage/plasmid-associated DNA primase